MFGKISKKNLRFLCFQDHKNTRIFNYHHIKPCALYIHAWSVMASTFNPNLRQILKNDFFQIYIESKFNSIVIFIDSNIKNIK